MRRARAAGRAEACTQRSATAKPRQVMFVRVGGQHQVLRQLSASTRWPKKQPKAAHKSKERSP
jgi:hypothetical protein